MTAHDINPFVAAPIGELLRARGALSDSDLAKGLAVQAEVGGLLGQALTRIGAVTEEDLLDCLAKQLAMPIIDINSLPEGREDFIIAAERLRLALPWFVTERAAVWITGTPRNETVNVLATNPLNSNLREKLENAVLSANLNDNAPVPIHYYLCDNQTVDIALAHYQYKDETDEDDFLGDASRLRELAEEAPVIDFVNNLFTGALKEGASDIHVESYEATAAVRYRIDGVLHDRTKLSRARFDAVASRIKLIAGMDIAERRLPQDGRCTVRFAGHDVDLRVSSVPSTWGESLVIRLLRKQTELPDLAGLGLDGRTSEVLQRILALPNGVFLVTGPTGSGKSTTLYRGLELINDGQRKIITIEDPVEYDVASITQIQVRSEIGYDFANGLRAILRQDPDVIMVGEIRDQETATIAAQAALTGHFVLSTLHTNSAIAAITRMKDIGLEAFLIAASVRGLMAQRLVRRLCEHCAKPAYSGDGEHLITQAIKDGFKPDPNPANWREHVGCDHCAGTGYAGRVALSEIVEIDDAFRQAIIEEASTAVMIDIARKQGFETLFENGLRKARRGETTLAEVLRVCSGDYV